MKPTNKEDMTAFLESLDITEKTNIHGALIKRGWANINKEARKLMNDCGYVSFLSSDDGWEPGIT